jgi:hypothetical protein
MAASTSLASHRSPQPTAAPIPTLSSRLKLRT